MAGKDSPKKIPVESSKAKAACDLYISMGVDRSIAKVAEQLGHPPSYRRTLEEWSRLHGWVARAKQWDEEQLEKQRKRREQELSRLYDELAKTCREQLGKTWNDLEKLRKSEKGIGSIATVNLLKLLIDTHIQALGGNDKQKVELTGKDGGPIETDLIVETFWGRGTDPRKRTDPSETEADDDDNAELTIDIDTEVDE